MDTLFDLGQIEEPKHKCNECEFFYRKYNERGNKSWGKCQLGKSSYDAPALKPACSAYKAREDGQHQ